VNRLRNRLILVFVAATLLPLAATVWVTTSLLERSLNFSTTDELDRVSRTLERTAHEFYQRQRDNLKQQAAEGRAPAKTYTDIDPWPPDVRAFVDSGQNEQFSIVGNQGDRLDYFVRRGRGVAVYSAPFGAVHMDDVTGEIRGARTLVDAVRNSDVPRGFNLAYIALAASFWIASLAGLIYLAHRMSRPIHQLTSGLGQLASGDLTARVEPQRDDEIGRAVQAFNDMAGKLQESTERLVYLRQMASWQTLARKMAHEVKNSLTPIRLTVEEMAARSEGADRAFMTQAEQIIVDEIETLERRIRAFSQFAAEPPVMAAPLDPNAVLQERVAFLRAGHPEVAYECRLAPDAPRVMADPDLLKGILTNLLENAAEAAGDGGRILGCISPEDGRVAIEVHDSGPGLSDQARSSLFQPTISFKKRGMGLGLSIARKSALLSGGDIVLVKGELGGAGFRVLLPIAKNGIEAHSDRG
jgi:two-component system, NtrC family, nitrogen regulation sensor histidine kinase NtrY